MLSVKHPTSTTVLYTVSTRSPSQSLSAWLKSALFALARVITGLLVASVLLYEYRLWSPLQSTDELKWVDGFVLDGAFGQLASLLSELISRPWRLLLCAGLTWLIFRKGYIEETLLVIRGLGVQTSTSSTTYLWAATTRFIPTSSVQDIFIHEAFKGFGVRYYLSIVVEGEDDVVVVFPVGTLLHKPDSIIKSHTNCRTEHLAAKRDSRRRLARCKGLPVRAEDMKFSLQLQDS